MRTEDYIAVRLDELCKNRNISKYRLSQLTGMSQTALGNIISKVSIPTIPTLEKICAAFEISIAQFFAGDGARPDLTEKQKELVETWNGMDAEEQRILLNFVRSMKK